MAIVPDLSGNSPASSLDGGVDMKLENPNRTTAASPVGVLTPMYSGEIVANTSNGDLWFAQGLTITSWIPYAKVL